MPTVNIEASPYFAVGDGTTDCTAAFMAFNADYQGQSGVILTLVAGHSYNFPAGSNANFCNGILGLTINGNGATFKSDGSAGFKLGATHHIPDATGSSLVQSALRGATTVRLITPVEHTRFTIGGYVALTGVDTQGNGFPPCCAFLDWLLITGKNTSIGDIGFGDITFSTPLRFDYKSTWPCYDPGGVGSASSGGPATLYAMHPNWNCVHVYNDLTLNQSGQGILASGRSITFNNCTKSDDVGVWPSVTALFTENNCSQSTGTIELDKFNDVVRYNGCTIHQLQCQSRSGAQLMTVNDSTISDLNGTPTRTVLSGTTAITTMSLGPIGSGNATDIRIGPNVTITSVVVNNIYGGGIAESGLLTNYTMSNGVLRCLKSNSGLRAWAVPGAWGYFPGTKSQFKIIDISFDATFLYATTTLTGNVVPGDIIALYPMPIVLCQSAGPDLSVLDWTAMVQGQPAYSYSKRTYGTIASSPNNPPAPFLIGKMLQLGITVQNAYTESGTKTLAAMDRSTFRNSDGTAFRYTPIVDLKTAIARVITPSNVTGAQSGDSALAMPEALFTFGTNFNGPNPSASVSSGQVQVEVKMDQGITTGIYVCNFV